MIQIYALKAFKDVLKGVIRDGRVTWLLEEMGVNYERISMDPTKGENKTESYLKLNPTGKVPTMVDGELVLFESAAICEYLATKHQKFIPTVGTKDYYLCKQWCYFILTNVDPLVSRVFGCDFFFEQNQTTQEIRQMATEQLPRFLSTLDQSLEKTGYLVGEEITLADMFMVCSFMSVRHTNMIQEYKNLKRHYEKLTERPAFKKAISQNGI